VPLTREFTHTRLASGDDAAWVKRRFTAGCAALGTDVTEEDDRLVARWRTRA
jgi:poly-gamma-glutamate synthesis protein (capsule biosynthesis protein)